MMEEAEPIYREFASKLLPGTDNLLGVRLPKLRKIARKLAKGEPEKYLAAEPERYFEEVMLRGILIGYAPFNIEQRKRELVRFIPAIRDWSVCDSSCITYKFMREKQKEWFDFLKGYMRNTNEFACRFAYVCLLDHFLNDEYVNRILIQLHAFNGRGYYDRMSVAWLLSVCYVKYKEKTLLFLEEADLDMFTYNKTLQKICESGSVSAEEKKVVRAMKKEQIVHE